MSKKDLLKINNLKISFRYGSRNIQVVRGISLRICENEILGILGESGSGKTVTASSVLRLTEYDSGKIDDGEIIFNNNDIMKFTEKEMRAIRGKEISYIFQNPVDSLNPHRKIGKQIEEVQRVHREKPSRKLIISLLEDMGLDNAKVIYDMYPSQLSGGQCQRIAIAMSLICKSKIIIADEPTSSIDASMQGIVLDLFRKINEKFGVAIIIITHNFEIVKNLCNRVVIMYGGLIMEQGAVEEVLNTPIHPYTRELIACASSINDNQGTLYTLEGNPPSPQEFKEECPFVSRCKFASEKCKNEIPKLKTFEGGREARCINV